MLAEDREGRVASPADVVRAVQPFAAGADLAVLAGAPSCLRPERGAAEDLFCPARLRLPAHPCEIIGVGHS